MQSGMVWEGGRESLVWEETALHEILVIWAQASWQLTDYIKLSSKSRHSGPKMRQNRLSHKMNTLPSVNTTWLKFWKLSSL